MPFAFRFQRILDLRESLERQQMLQLSAALARYDVIAGEIAKLNSEMEASVQGLRRLYQQVPLSPLDVERAHTHQNWLDTCIKGATSRLAAAKEEVEAAREQLKQATLQRKVMERLRERHASEYHRMQDRREQAALDEIGTRWVQK